MQRQVSRSGANETFPLPHSSQAKAKKSRNREPALTPVVKNDVGPDYKVFNALKSWSNPKQQSSKPKFFFCDDVRDYSHLDYIA